MAITRLGAMKIAAKKLGITLETYQTKSRSGEKWCTICKQWKIKKEFYKDFSRGDGLSSKCKQCNYARLSDGPTKEERREMMKDKVKWCSYCKTWHPMDTVIRGRCQHGWNQYHRNKYANDENFREERKEHRDKYKRGVDRVPKEGREILLEEFDYKCAYCGKPWETWDHIVPVSKDGKTTPGNMVPSCRSCNSSKKDQDVIEWLDKRGLEGNYHIGERMALSKAGLYE